ncbi:methyltransferase [Novispirillum itersonii]|uniref:Malonyl-CoA O-methyltransferase n=1 Tax=Novispirillum itersonii TaxID=189 RepID=A0A7X0DPV5_NOVIT|nr:methyltransferase [Novispirillum itersonii]MBB6211682.1 malonyl-CoA O-methyltransferase [Novispirillum itersonii]
MRTPDWKTTVRSRFDSAAATYDRAGEAQHRIAVTLAAEIRQRLPSTPLSGLEIGCGTGFLTAALLPALPAGSRWQATDLSPAMVQACLSRVSPPPGITLTGAVMDGEAPEMAPEQDRPVDLPVDLVASSMAVQWFTDLPAGLRRLRAMLAPGGLLAVTTLGSGTFAEWRDACRAAGVTPGTPPYPTADALRMALGPGAEVRQHRQPLPFPGVGDFLHHLRGTGARTAAPGHPPLPAGQLRRVLRALHGRPFLTAYDVLTVLWPAEDP